MKTGELRISFENFNPSIKTKRQFNELSKIVNKLLTLEQGSLIIIKNSSEYEALFSGRAQGAPIGFYLRGINIGVLIENINRKTTKEARKLWKTQHKLHTNHRKNHKQFFNHAI